MLKIAWLSSINDHLSLDFDNFRDASSCSLSSKPIVRRRIRRSSQARNPVAATRLMMRNLEASAVVKLSRIGKKDR